MIWTQGKQAAFIPALRDIHFGPSKDLRSEGKLLENLQCMEVWGSHFGLYIV